VTLKKCEFGSLCGYAVNYPNCKECKICIEEEKKMNKCYWWYEGNTCQTNGEHCEGYKKCNVSEDEVNCQIYNKEREQKT
jgi:hypothetical protein